MARYTGLAVAGPRTRPRPHGRTPFEMLAQAAGARRRDLRHIDLRGVRVLVVEDHADSREMLRQIVESFGAKATIAADGREALATAAWLRPDLVFC
ncbi:MAG TPA: hypothetical protein VMR21_13570, partial [Vicinamibacteria bacterium]|nr:hypothetical protein [Vicinamibacteria bacterium]